MRIALHAVGEVGRRAGLILLAERDLSALGRYGHRAPAGEDRRSMRISSLEGFDVLVTDDPVPSPIAAIAADDRLACVSVGSVEEAIAARFSESGTVLVTGADLRAIAAALAAHEAARVDTVGATSAAWTVPGKALRNGIGVGFPDPVGPRWGHEVEGGIEVPVPGDWAAAAATVAGVIDGQGAERVVGVADHRAHLQAVALAAAAIAVATGGYSSGPHDAADAPEAFLAAALRVGMGVAAFTLD